MKNIWIVVALATLVIAGCGNSTADPAATDSPTATSTAGASSNSGNATLVAYELGSKKKGDKGVCVICNKNDGTTAEEEVKETVDYEGKTYIFCSEAEKAEFISDPKRYVAGK